MRNKFLRCFYFVDFFKAAIKIKDCEFLIGYFLLSSIMYLILKKDFFKLAFFFAYEIGGLISYLIKKLKK